MPDLVRIPASVFPRDSDGFLSGECPVCERTFKVRFDEEAESAGQELSDEEASDDADRMRRFCPLCHELASPALRFRHRRAVHPEQRRGRILGARGLVVVVVANQDLRGRARISGAPARTIT